MRPWLEEDEGGRRGWKIRIKNGIKNGIKTKKKIKKLK